MSDTMSPRRRHSRRLRVFCLLLLVAAAVSAAIWFAPRHGDYKRYVSRPLADGTRFTFLYLAYMSSFQEGPGGSGGVVYSAGAWCRQDRTTGAERLRGILSGLGPPPPDSITVVVVPLKSGEARASRWHEYFHKGMELRRNEYILDSRTRTQYSLYYSCLDSGARQFDARNGTIGRSLHILPPVRATPAF